MTVKHTKAVIMGKFNDYLKSITDVALREEVREHAIIAGGSIASLLQGEEYNDLDIYFDSKSVLVEVVDYYTKYWNDNHNSTVTYIRDESSLQKYKERLINQEVDDIMDSADEDEEDITKEEAIEQANEQYDFLEYITIDESGVYMFIRSSGIVEEKKMTEEQIEELQLPKYRPVFITDNAISLADNIQIITRFSGEPDDIIKRFDYAHTTNYLVPSERKLELNKKALSSLLTKELVYVGSEFPLCSIFRMRKFLDRGYTINAGQILKMVFQLNQMDLTDIRVLRKQLIGVDSTYMVWFVSELFNKTKGGKEEDLNDYVGQIISKLFDEDI